MFRYIIRRIILLIPVMLGVSFLIFFIMDLAPGSIIDTRIAENGMSAEEAQLLREQYNLTGSVLTRYLKYLSGLSHGDLGLSWVTGEPVMKSYLSKLPATIVLACASIFVSVVLSLPMGILSAVKRGSITDLSLIHI